MELEIQSSLFKLKGGQIWLGEQRVVLLFLSLGKICLKWESQTIQSSVFKVPSDSRDNNHPGTSGHGRHAPPSKFSPLPHPPSLTCRGTKGLAGQPHTRCLSPLTQELRVQRSYTRITLEKGNTQGPRPGGSARGPGPDAWAHSGKARMTWNPAPGLRVQSRREPHRREELGRRNESPFPRPFLFLLHFQYRRRGNPFLRRGRSHRSSQRAVRLPYPGELGRGRKPDTDQQKHRACAAEVASPTRVNQGHFPPVLP